MSQISKSNPRLLTESQDLEVYPQTKWLWNYAKKRFEWIMPQISTSNLRLLTEYYRFKKMFLQ